MAPQTSVLIITWGAIVLLAFGLAGCLRAIHTLRLQIDDRYQSPRRLQVGDALTLPPALSAAVAGHRLVALLFVTASCSVCRTAIDALRPTVDGLPDVALQVLWSDDRPPGYEQVGLAHQGDVFRALKVPVTPLLVVVELAESTVVARGLLGSPEELRHAQDALRQASATGSGHGAAGSPEVAPDPSPRGASGAQVAGEVSGGKVAR